MKTSGSLRSNDGHKKSSGADTGQWGNLPHFSGYGGHIGGAEAGGWDQLGSPLGTLLYLHKNAMRVKLTKNHFLLIY